MRKRIVGHKYVRQIAWLRPSGSQGRCSRSVAGLQRAEESSDLILKVFSFLLTGGDPRLMMKLAGYAAPLCEVGGALRGKLTKASL